MIKKPVNGMRDILPAEMEIRDYVIGLVKETYRTFGYTPMETPCVESIENLSGKQGGENEKLVFKIMKRGEKLQIETGKTENDLADSGLRYDLTMPLSRYYANHQAELPKPFKALQIGPVWRAERPQKGRFRQFYQCDIDVLGDPTNLCETELILATTTVLSKLGFKGFEIRLNDRRILKAMAEYSGFPEDRLGEVYITLDKMDKIGIEGVRRELSEEGFAADSVEKYLTLFEIVSDENEKELLGKLTEKLGGALPSEVSDNLCDIIRMVNAAKESDFELVFDPTLVRGMGYYTGPIFEISVPEFGSSVGGGGRYDEMVGKFLGQPVPACGFSIGFERIISILLEQGFKVPGSSDRIALLLEKNLSVEKTQEAFVRARELRKEGKQVLISVMAKNKRFQKEQLASEGYGEIVEIYENPLQ